MTQAKRVAQRKEQQAECDEKVLYYIGYFNSIGKIANDVELGMMFNIHKDLVRKSVERLRENHIIWNFQDGLGYFIGETDTENGNRLNDRWLAQEDSRAIRTFKHSTFARSQRKNPDQLTMQRDMHITEILKDEPEISVVERYFEAMKVYCNSATCDSCLDHSCKMYKSCNAFGGCPNAHSFFELTASQLTALEPYAKEWAEQLEQNGEIK